MKNYNIEAIIGMACFTFILIILMLGLIYPIETKIEFKCDSGNLDIDYQSDFIVSSYTTYKTEYVPKVLNINGLDNVRCEGTYYIKGNIFNIKMINN